METHQSGALFSHCYDNLPLQQSQRNRRALPLRLQLFHT